MSFWKKSSLEECISRGGAGRGGAVAVWELAGRDGDGAAF